jgi:hypothetical protein
VSSASLGIWGSRRRNRVSPEGGWTLPATTAGRSADRALRFGHAAGTGAHPAHAVAARVEGYRRHAAAGRHQGRGSDRASRSQPVTPEGHPAPGRTACRACPTDA